MGISLLAPLFLAGLAALAIPVIIHLTHRERKEAVVFPSLMFLQKIPYQAARRQRLRHILLFALRCLALILIALAFARPFLDRGRAPIGGALGQAREVVVLLDRSYSMAYDGRWARALAAAGSVIDRLGPDDRATLVGFSETATALSEPSSDRAALRAALAGLTPGDGATRFEPALRLASRILDNSERPRAEVVLITDFQRGGWSGGGAVRLPAGATLTRVDLSDRTTSDVAVARVDVRRTSAGGRDEAVVVARLVNRSAEAIPALQATLEVAGRAMESKTVSIDANGVGAVEFAPLPIPAGETRAAVRIPPDRLTKDDAFHFVLSRGRTIPVLHVQSPDVPASRSVYLTRALALGLDPAFAVETRSRGALSAADLRGKALVILDDAGVPGGALGAELARWVRDGGGLIVATGDRASPRDWPASTAELVPAVAAAPVDRQEQRGGVIGYIDRSHPIFEPFNAPRSGDFAAAHVYRYRAVTPAPGDRELARFDDGRVALLERRLGRGRVLVWASSLDNVWTDIPVQPVFLPFVHELVKYAASYAPTPLAHTVGASIDVRDLVDDGAGGAARAQRGAAADAGRFVAVSPSGRRIQLGADSSAAGRGATALALGEQGVYEVRPGGSPAARPWLVAANVDPAESELAAMDPEQLAAAVVPRAGARQASSAEPLTPVELERRQGVWWYLLMALLLLLAGETLLANRLSRDTRRVPLRPVPR